MQLTALRRCVALSGLFWAYAVAAQSQPADGAAPPEPAGSRAAAGGQGTSDEDFIEFLGADDTGDAAWWEFLQHSATGQGRGQERGEDRPPEPPPKDGTR